MSSVTALNGAQFDGMIGICDAGLTGMISLRGDLQDAAFTDAVQSAIGCTMPRMRTISHNRVKSVAWMAPDELLLLGAYNSVAQCLAKLQKALGGQHFMALDVSDARQVFSLSGMAIREVLAKGSPADLCSDVLELNEIRRTRLGQLPVAFWFDAKDKARLICFRSVGDYVFEWLCMAAEPSGRVDF